MIAELEKFLSELTENNAEFSSIVIYKKYKVEDLEDSRRGIKTYINNLDSKEEATEWLEEFLEKEENSHLEGLIGVQSYYEVGIDDGIHFLM